MINWRGTFAKVLEKDIEERNINIKNKIENIDNQKEIIGHYGIRKQLEHFNEEVRELTEAITIHEFLNEHCIDGVLSSIETIENIEQEVADVYNFLEQFVIHYELDTERIKDIQIKKQERTIYEFKNNIKKEDRV